MPFETQRPLVIWRLTDGKPGHEKQTLGLAHALLRKTAGECLTLRAPSPFASLMNWITGRFPSGEGLPAPDLILAAGHATHLALLAARRARGGKKIVLMKPSLPLCLFDLCVIPEHDDPPRGHNVVGVLGVLNDVAPPRGKNPRLGLILAGGASSHYRWDDQAVGRAVVAIARATPGVSWQLATSRRTPQTFLASLADRPDNLTLVPHEDTGPGWLENALADCGQAWVTEDSVSMLYEALTAGAAVGLLRLPSLRTSRVKRGVEQLVSEGWVTPYERWQVGQSLEPSSREFNEADRVAGLILDKLSDGWA